MGVNQDIEDNIRTKQFIRFLKKSSKQYQNGNYNDAEDEEVSLKLEGKKDRNFANCALDLRIAII